MDDFKPDVKMNAGRVRSMNNMAKALFDLMRDVPFEQITVTDLCTKAGVVRKTFYRNFAFKTAIVEYKFDSLFAELKRRFEFGVSETRDILLFSFEYLNSEREFAAVFTDSGLTEVVRAKIKGFVEQAYSDSLHGGAAFEPALADYCTTFIADGLASFIRTWVNDNFKQPPKAVAALVGKFYSNVFA